MKRIVALVAPLLLLAAVVTALAAAEERRVPDWEAALQEYIAGNSRLREPVAVVQVVAASRPRRFTAAMGTPVQNDWPWGIDALPFPPEAVKCVLLQAGGGGLAAPRRVVYVAYHDDGLWRAGWLVHEGPKTLLDPDAGSDLTAVGCGALHAGRE